VLSKTIFGALLCVVVITPIPYGTIEPWWKAVFVCAVLAIFITATVERPIRVNPFPVLLPLLALTALAFIQTGGISADTFQTRFFVLQLLALTAFLALLYRYAATEQRLRVLVFVVIGVAIASAIFGILRQTTQQQVGFVLPLLRPNQGFAQFVNKNHFAYLMEMALGLGIGLLFGERSRRLVYLALLLPIWTGLVLANSRGGILAMLAQVVLAALLVLNSRPAVSQTPRRVALKAVLVVVLVAGVLAGTLWVGGDRLVSNFAGSELTAGASSVSDGASRNEIWRATLKLFTDHPILGAGLGGYWIGITAYHDASGVLIPQEAHNDYLELLASGGVIGLAIAIWFAAGVVRAARRNWWSNAGFVRNARVGAVVGIAGVAAHSLVDFGLHLMGNAVIFLTLIMIATATIDSEKFVALNPEGK
jgi:O-antigen ligase